MPQRPKSVETLTVKQRESKLAEIRKSVSEFDAHKNDSYSYYPEEITQVRDFKDGARDNIGFLLDEVDRLKGSRRGSLRK